jgi:NAD(P)-dependent dehydrogenase (short-subunit alcohol dehydrogenase family)
MIKNISFNFSKKNYVITGAGKGIGYSVLTKLYQSGANIALITRSKSDLKNIEKKFSSNRVISFCGDVSDNNDRISFFNLVKKKMKNIDGLVNNAGIRQRKEFKKISQNELDHIYEINIKSVFFLTQLFFKLMKKTKGSIVNISSIVGPIGFNNLSGYAFTKSGLIGLTKSIANELAKQKIRVNSISPGFIKSSYATHFKKNNPELYDYTISRTLLKRWGECDEVADLILFLLSNNSLFITGNNIFIDGGWSAN